MSVHDTTASGNARKPISRRLRFEILRRDDNTCRYCGGKAPDVTLTVDHVVPVALGGSDDPTNLVAACKDCNAGKSSSTPDTALVAQVDEDAVRWATAMRMAADREAQRRELLDEQLRPFFEHWYSLVPSYKLGNPYWELPNNWREQVVAFIRSGLSDDMLIDAARVALTTRGVDDRFRYFIGVARRKLSDLIADARFLIEQGAV